MIRLLLALLLLATPASAGMVIGSGATADYSDIILWEDFLDNSTPFGLTSSNCNTGTDTVWGENQQAVVDATAALSGSYGVNIPSEAVPDNADYLALDIASGDYFNATKGAIVFTFKVTYAVSGGCLVLARETSGTDTDNVTIMLAGATDFNVRLHWRPADTAEINIVTSGASLDVNTQYWCVAMWDQTAPSVSIQVYDASGSPLGSAGTSTASMTAMPDISTAGYIRVGDVYGTDDTVNGVGEYVDKLVIFDGSITRTAAEYLAIAKEIASCPL